MIGAYDADRIRPLKDEVDGDLYVSGSITLVRALLADGLVDELHLFVYPVTRGEGPRLFTDDAGGHLRARRPSSTTTTAWSTSTTGRPGSPGPGRHGAQRDRRNAPKCGTVKAIRPRSPE